MLDAQLAWNEKENVGDDRFSGIKAVSTARGRLNPLLQCDVARFCQSLPSLDTAGLLRFCDMLRRNDNGATADAIMAFMKKGGRATSGLRLYASILPIPEPTDVAGKAANIAALPPLAFLCSDGCRQLSL